MLSDQDKFKLANDLDFSFAIMDAEEGKRPLAQNAFQTIGDRIRLIEELEKRGFHIVKIQK